MLRHDGKLCAICRLGKAFIKPAFYKPLVQNEDPLGGLHANTHLAQVGALPCLPTAACRDLRLAAMPKASCANAHAQGAC